MASWINTSYTKLDENLKIKRSQSVQNKASLDLYSALLMTKEDATKKVSKKNNKMVHDLLTSDSKEQLSENDKERLFYVIDYLRIKWNNTDLFKKFTKTDFDKIKWETSTSNKIDELINLVIDKAADWLSEKDKEDLHLDVSTHVSQWMKWKEAEIGDIIAESLALKRISTNRFRLYGAKIRNLLKKNGWDMSKCYMDVIKLSNYASMWLLKRTGTRRIVPMKFEWRNIHKQTQKTLDGLSKRSAESDNQAERLSINYIIKKLRIAYNLYKDTIWVSNKDFDKAQHDNEDRIRYAEAA